MRFQRVRYFLWISDLIYYGSSDVFDLYTMMFSHASARLERSKGGQENSDVLN